MLRGLKTLIDDPQRHFIVFENEHCAFTFPDYDASQPASYRSEQCSCTLFARSCSALSDPVVCVCAQ